MCVYGHIFDDELLHGCILYRTYIYIMVGLGITENEATMTATNEDLESAIVVLKRQMLGLERRILELESRTPIDLIGKPLGKNYAPTVRGDGTVFTGTIYQEPTDEYTGNS